MELITTQYGKVVTISNVGATPIMPVRKAGDEVEVDGVIMIVTGEFHDSNTWFELETVRHDSRGQVYINEERGKTRVYKVVEKRLNPLVRRRKGQLVERIA